MVYFLHTFRVCASVFMIIRWIEIFSLTSLSFSIQRFSWLPKSTSNVSFCGPLHNLLNRIQCLSLYSHVSYLSLPSSIQRFSLLPFLSTFSVSFCGLFWQCIE
jgi:hypothetical protein